MTAAAPARFTGRTALLTAAASGIGAATARRLAADGASVLVTDLDAEGVRRGAEEIRAAGGRVRDQRLDVTSPGQWAEAAAEPEPEPEPEPESWAGQRRPC
jgi:NAD(P)-dependent dehydrogenase (short-subunit alcohol dehydrogenase family)